MSAQPVPAPRSNLGTKKPIPAPRTTVPVQIESAETSSSDSTNVQDPQVVASEGKNSFGRKVLRSLSVRNNNEISVGAWVNDGKKAVLESTRQSVRRITRRFTDNFITENVPTGQSNAPAEKEHSNAEDLKVFNSIIFDSPISGNESLKAESIYENDEEFEDLPPPSYPPPSLPNETYDIPSLASGSTTSSEETRRNKHSDYESVFPLNPYNSDSDSCIDMTAGTLDSRVSLNRTNSWNFYDTAQLEQEKQKTIANEPTYNNVDNTPAMSTTSAKSYTRTNSLYENCEIIPQRRRSPTQSVLMLFDPLTMYSSPENQQLSQAEELNELDRILQGDLEGSVNMDNLSIFDDVSEGDDHYISPPAPPERIDSLPDIDPEPRSALPRQENAKVEAKEGRSSWYIGNNNNTTAPPKAGNSGRVPILILKKINNFVGKAPEYIRGQFSKKDNILTRPMIQSKHSLMQKGMLLKVMNGPVDDLFGELNARWCVLQPGLLVCYSDNSCDNIKENIPADSVLSVQIVQDQKFKYKHEEDDLFCFELNIAGKVRAGYIYGTKSQSERRIWMQNLAENLCHTFGARITCNYTRIGWTYMKAGVNGQWKGAWLCLVKRKLYYIDDNTNVKLLDLRKARWFKLEAFDEASSASTTDKGPNIVIHFTSDTYYFRMWTQRETKVWCHIIKLAARDNGPNLNHQQLTKNDVPVIVEKCINFVYVHGSMTEGIYRCAGSNSTVAELMNQFRSDAWSVQLTNKYSAHDVANVLKRFFRELAEPLIDTGKRQYMYQVSLVKNRDDKVRMYKSIFDQLPKIAMNTAQRLLGHLFFISTQSKKNLMTITNLGAIWGPTLLHGAADDGEKDRSIMYQLIELYRDIFPEDQRVREQELKMLSILEKYSNSPQGAINVKSSGDFRVWVYLYNKEGRTFNILVGPNKTAYSILCELSSKVNVPVHELVLEELVLNDQLTRPIHHTERVLDVVMRWSYWDEADRKENCLVLNNISKYWEYLNDNNLPLSGDVKYADNKCKAFKTYKFEFQQSKLTYYKDRQTNNMLGQWNIEDIFIYFGSEPKRSAPFTLTFFPRTEYPKRNKTRPYFGHIISFPDPSMKATWVSTMWRAEHQNNLTAPPQHVNLMTA